MTPDDVMGVAQRLNGSLEALAALAAAVRIRSEGLSPEPAVAAAIDRVVGALGLEPASLTALAPQLGPVVGMARAFFRQADDLMATPSRATAWSYDDPVVLQGQGRGSMAVAPLLARVAPRIGGLDAALRRPGARFLDIGTGVGLLAVALCQAFPELRVTGIDPWPRSLELAEKNVADFGLSDRIELRAQAIEQVDDDQVFDAVWVPGPFLPAPAFVTALAKARTALRRGGWAVVGLYAAPPDPLAQALLDLRVLRSGGHPWAPAEAAEHVRAAGFGDAVVVERDWHAPIQFVVAPRP